MKLLYSKTGRIGRLTLSNPPHNRLTSPVFAEAAELEAFLADPELVGVIVVGEGKNFCAGADLNVLAPTGEHAVQGAKSKVQDAGRSLAGAWATPRPRSGQAIDHPPSHEASAGLRRPSTGSPALTAELGRGKELLEILESSAVPVLAAIAGSCLGAGLEIALACHFRFATPGALLGFPESEHGLLPGLGGTVLGTRTLGTRRAAELMLSGRMLRGDEALAIGLVDRCVDLRDLVSEGERYLAALTEGRAPALIRAIMTAIHNAGHLDRQEALRRETDLFCQAVEAAGSPDKTSGPKGEG
jgi:enoyl-CoA hydratase/carnithine racemase